jgi:oligosaccharide reducing-end xylanase
MKSRKLNKWGLAVLLNALMVPVLAGVESPFEVGTWGNFCDGAISHTFDDYPTSSTNQQTASGRDAFNQYNLHMTLFVQVGSVTNQWSTLSDMFKEGHEIASHNMQHNVNTGDFQKSQNTIQKNVPGEMCATLAYPNCSCNQDAATLKVFIAARSCGEGVNSKTPSNFAQIQAKMFGGGYGKGCSNCPNDAKSLNNFADQSKSGKWVVTCHHGIGSDGHNWAVTDLNAMKEHLQYLDQNRDKIWCETFGNVARYIKERDAVSLSVTSSDDNSITVSVTDNLDNSIYDYPLSIRRPLPDGWTDPVVTQDGEEVESSVDNGYVMFKAVPDGGEVVISRDPVRALKHLSHKNSGSSPVVLKNSVLLIDQQYFNGSELAVTIFNLTGKMLGSYKTGKNESRIVLPAGKINRAAFVAKITGKDKTLIQKFMPQM